MPVDCLDDDSDGENNIDEFENDGNYDEFDNECQSIATANSGTTLGSNFQQLVPQPHQYGERRGIDDRREPVDKESGQISRPDVSFEKFIRETMSKAWNSAVQEIMTEAKKHFGYVSDSRHIQ